MGGSEQQNGGMAFLDMAVTIIILVAICFLFKYIWHGAIWLFNEYISLIKVK